MEAEGLAEQIIVLEDGDDIVSGTPLELTRRFWPHAVVQLAAEDPAIARRRPGHPRRAVVRRPASPAVVQLDDERRVADLVAALTADGVRLTRVEPLQPTLEDLYFAVRTRSDMSEDGGRQLVPTAARAFMS